MITRDEKRDDIMYRVLYAREQLGYYAIKIPSIEKDASNIRSYISDGDAVIICNKLEDITEMLNVKIEDLTVVPEEGWMSSDD